MRFQGDLLERAMIPLHAILVLIAALSAISSAGVLVSAMPTLDAWAIAWWRMLGTAILLSPLLRRLPRSEWSRVGIAGIFLALHFALWFMSLQRIPVMRSTLLVTLAPIWAGLVEWLLLKQAPHKMFWLGLLVALPGVGWMSGGAELGSADWLGDGLALAGGITGSMYFVVGGEVRKRVGVLPLYVWRDPSCDACVVTVSFGGRRACCPERVDAVGASWWSYSGTTAHWS